MWGVQRHRTATLCRANCRANCLASPRARRIRQKHGTAIRDPHGPSRRMRMQCSRPPYQPWLTAAGLRGAPTSALLSLCSRCAVLRWAALGGPTVRLCVLCRADTRDLGPFSNAPVFPFPSWSPLPGTGTCERLHVSAPGRSERQCRRAPVNLTLAVQCTRIRCSAAAGDRFGGQLVLLCKTRPHEHLLVVCGGTSRYLPRV